MYDTLSVLNWARDYGKKNDIVKLFWDKLCDTLGMPATSSGYEILSEARSYGGNTFVNVIRGEGVPYVEVAYDVAGTLLPTFKWAKDYQKGDLVSIERYVLKQMEVSDDDLKKISKGIESTTNDIITDNTAKRGVSTAVAEFTAYSIGKKLGSKAAKAVLEKAAEAAVKKAAKKTAGAAAKKAARKATEIAAKQVAKQVLAKVIAALNIVFLAWAVVDIAGPAMRKTIPSVTYIALLRQIHQNVNFKI